jgi:hypothetical protein
MGMAESDVRERTYTFLRMALVALLVSLGAAVIWQTYRQGWRTLDSVSAYYYTPAQGIFVGALIGLGACMIALRGGNTPEEVFLNLGGMFAAGVAVVPTARGADYRTAIEACRQADSPLLTQKGAIGFDCPTVRALEAATRANVENNVVALLVVGVLALAATWLLASRDTSPGGGTRSVAFRWGFGTSVAILAVTAALVVWNLDVIIANYHYVCAIGLFVCIVAVALSNAVRHRGIEVTGSGLAMAVPGLRAGVTALRPEPGRPNLYAGLAWALLAVAVGGVIAVRAGLVSLFWLELVAAVLFILFWLAQTFAELPPKEEANPDIPEYASGVGNLR